ncbi:MAG: hypothetical protein GY714_10480 [Desulfobacterales bacterium]|nr:hypothetical protein [Desulfobacterales bacterium]
MKKAKQLILIEKSVLIDENGDTYDDNKAPFPEIQIAKYTMVGNSPGHKKANQIVEVVLGPEVKELG